MAAGTRGAGSLEGGAVGLLGDLVMGVLFLLSGTKIEVAAVVEERRRSGGFGGIEAGMAGVGRGGVSEGVEVRAEDEPVLVKVEEEVDACACA